jgi:acetyl-CoA carboxylase carboxyltransferase component
MVRDSDDDEIAPLQELAARRASARRMGGEEAVARWHEKGLLTARERIEAFVDAGSFDEFGVLTGKGQYDAAGKLREFTPANCVTGRGQVEGRPLMVVADDFTIRGGSSEGAVADKWIYAERMACEFRMPLVRFVDSAGGSVKLLEQAGRTKIPGYVLWPSTAMMGTVPVASVAFGACVGLGAVRAIGAHFSVMVKGQAQVFAAGPPVVKQGLGHDVTKEELGGYELCTRVSGIINNAAEDERAALAQVRRFLSYLPGHAWEIPPRIETGDDPSRRMPALNTLIPEDRRKGYAARRIVEAVFDQDSLFEIAPGFGASVRTYLARLDGYAVGVMLGDPAVMGGALTRAAGQKIERFVDICDSFHLPVVNLVDQPGVMIGLDAERAGTLLAAARASAAIEQASVPWISIVVRRAFGVAGSMLGPWQGPSGTSLNHRFAWPSARWGSIPIEGGVAAAYKREIEAAPDPQQHREELERYYQRLASPFRTAEAFGVVDIVEPAETRPLLCRWIHDAQRRLRTQALGPKRRTMR